MAGGIGSRFWPMSTPERPKQFIDVLGTGRTLIQMTFDRFEGLVDPANVWVVTSEKYKKYVREQLPAIPEDNILLEPCMRSTAPCIAYVSWKIASRDASANLVFSPADHIVLDVVKFRESVSKALEESASTSKIITLGMQPTRPDTGYGYIKASVPFDAPADGKSFVGDIVKVEAFKEKPCLEVAQSYLAEGGYYWNSGLFIWNVQTVLSSFRALKPDMAAIFDELAPSFYTASEKSEVGRLFPTCETISVDYAIMEKSSDVYTLPASFGWSDVGTWGSLLGHLSHDSEGNGAVGNVRLIDSKGCVVHVPEEKKVVVEGLEDCIVAEHDGTLLICRLSSEQLIKEFSK